MQPNLKIHKPGQWVLLGAVVRALTDEVFEALFKSRNASVSQTLSTPAAIE
jgi:hypothetical protein